MGLLASIRKKHDQKHDQKLVELVDKYTDFMALFLTVLGKNMEQNGVDAEVYDRSVVQTMKHFDEYFGWSNSEQTE